MNEDTLRERLTNFLKYKRISKTDFGKSIGVSSAFVTSIRKSIQPDKIKSIALNYPELNINWLITGEGEMLNENEIINKNQEIPISDIIRELSEQRKLTQKAQEQIDKLLVIIDKLSSK